MTITIQNKTPWNTSDLEAFLVPLLVRCKASKGTLFSCADKIRVETIQHLPGVAADEQRLMRVGDNGGEVRVEILSPKRAAKLLEPLDRLSLADALQPHEAALPSAVIADIEHAFITAANTPTTKQWDIYTHLRGNCPCAVTRTYQGVIRGDTKVKTKEGPSVHQLEAKLGCIDWRLNRLEEEKQELAEKREHLVKRIAKAKANKAMTPEPDHIH